MYKQFSRMALTMTAGLLLATAALAAPHGGPPFQELDLTTEQRDQMRALWEEQRADLETSQQQRRDVQTLIRSGNIDEAADLAAEHARQHVRKMADLRARTAEILTAEQMQKLDAAMDERREDRGPQRRGPRRGHR